MINSEYLDMFDFCGLKDHYCSSSLWLSSDNICDKSKGCPIFISHMLSMCVLTLIYFGVFDIVSTFAAWSINLILHSLIDYVYDEAKQATTYLTFGLRVRFILLLLRELGMSCCY